MAVNALLAVFAKAPEPGKVKTRLQPSFSPQQSAELHRRLVVHTLKQLSLTDSATVELWVSPEHEYWQQFAYSKYVQQGDDLGARLKFAVKHMFTRSNKAIVVGTDCPYLDSACIDRVVAALDHYDAVIVPANDGGYVLLGLSTCYLEVFDGISWGGSNVYEQTVKNLEQLGAAWQSLLPLSDIDRPEDVTQLSAHYPELTAGL
ncbi:TIGR04282 family arsenosugar biosynthesis glycosyltransferase [bacterium]|nr:TIGR04282 family arsenosugar biosynthesis glycosyltransferase [bacterium]